MNLKAECKVCLMNQTLKVLNTINTDEKKSKEVIDEISSIVSNIEYNLTPPEVAIKTYSKISELTGIYDLYRDEKLNAIEKAKGFVPFLEKLIENSDDKLFSAIKIAVAGNVLDLATPTNFELDSEIENIFDLNFAIDDSEKLRDDLEIAKEIVILADNAGENIFDNIFIETLNSLYPNLKIYYAPRSKPMINDITYEELKDTEIEDIATLVDTGVTAAGFLYNLASEEFKEIYNRADLIISKGMGNFETLNEVESKKIYFLFKVKCNVVSNTINQKIGTIICKSNM